MTDADKVLQEINTVLGPNEELHGRTWMSGRIKKSVDWISHNLKDIPHIRIGKDVWFTESHVQMFLKQNEVLPTVGRTPRSRGKQGAR